MLTYEDNNFSQKPPCILKKSFSKLLGKKCKLFKILNRCLPRSGEILLGGFYQDFWISWIGSWFRDNEELTATRRESCFVSCQDSVNFSITGFEQDFWTFWLSSWFNRNGKLDDSMQISCFEYCLDRSNFTITGFDQDFFDSSGKTNDSSKDPGRMCCWTCKETKRILTRGLSLTVPLRPLVNLRPLSTVSSFSLSVSNPFSFILSFRLTMLTVSHSTAVEDTTREDALSQCWCHERSEQFRSSQGCIA